MSEPRVFISYSHDSDLHRQFVLDISDRLRQEGLDCLIDQYVNGTPPEGWQCWMEDQIEQADFVLLVCTANYLQRYRRKARDGGHGVTFEGVVISQTLYDHYYQNTKFIPIIPADGNLDHVPLSLKDYTCYTLPDDYDTLYRLLTGQPKHIAPPIGSIRSMPPANVTVPSNIQIHSDRLPKVIGKFFGREDELQLLDDAWDNNEIRIIQFIAPGGAGKTQLLRHWIDHCLNNCDTMIAWSFYSQGAREDKQTPASFFFSHAFDKLGSTCDLSSFSTEENKGSHLAKLLLQHRTILVLDGLEPLQHAGKGMRGELKDRAIRQLLKNLARQNNGLCIITTRIELPELDGNRHTISKNLENLAVDDGVKLLQSLGVHGSDAEIKKAVNEYGSHALALHLFGNALHTYLDGDIQKRDTLNELIGEYDDIEQHAFKIMQAYSHWLKDTPELKLLHLLGLFDHPIKTEVLQVLWQAQIPDLTKAIDEKAWKIAIRDLREKHRLLAVNEHHTDQLDCHPLIREYFGKQLRETYSEAWKQAHEQLYDYYKALPEKECPDTLEEMQPLFYAVAHGCAAGLHQQLLDEVYWPRIKRQDEHYLTQKLGAFNDDLAVLAHFFITPWHKPAESLEEFTQSFVLNWTGVRLRALGRLHEAMEPMQAALEISIQQKQWVEASIDANNLSELQLILGNVTAAVVSSQQSVDYADRSEDMFGRMSRRTTHADTLHQAGETTQAQTLFIEAEHLQQAMHSNFPRLNSLWGFRYCDLLLAQGASDDVLERAKYDLDCWTNHFTNGSLLDFSLPKLTLGRAYHQRGKFSQAFDWLDQAVSGLRKAGTRHHLPRGLLAPAALYSDTHNPNNNLARAYQDLLEVYDIAEPSGMRLHLTDYHLAMTRLLLAEEECGVSSPDEVDGRKALTLPEHVAKAKWLIDETSYKRRLPELDALQKQIAL